MPSESDPTDSSVVSIDLPRDGGWVELDERLRALAGDVRVVVVRVPAGDGGGEISDDAAAPIAAATQTAAVARARALERLTAPDVIFVAVVTGRCDGAALAVALACDVRVADLAATFAFSSAEMFGVLGRLVAAVGQSRAVELCLAGRRMGASEATACGLVSVAVGGGQLADAIDDLTAALLATPRELATELKRALLAASSGPVSQRKISLSEELAAIVRLAGDDEDGRER